MNRIPMLRQKSMNCTALTGNQRSSLLPQNSDEPAAGNAAPVTTCMLSQDEQLVRRGDKDPGNVHR